MMRSKQKRIITTWLYTGLVLIALMVIIGGITRLTHSGLSMVEWKLIGGIVPPLNELQWQETFEKYKLANLTLGFSFLIIWIIIFWMINRDLNSTSYELAYDAVKTQIVPSDYNKHPDRLAKFEGMLMGDEGFIVSEDESITLDSVMYNGNAIMHKYSSKKKKSEKEEEQTVFDAEYVAEILAISDTENAIAYYSEKKDIKTVNLSELSFETVITTETEVASNELIISKISKRPSRAA